LCRLERGAAARAARDFGIDLTLLSERLKRTPEERLMDLQDVMTFHEEVRGAARNANGKTPRNADRSGKPRR
jgi:hypothetical protein